MVLLILTAIWAAVLIPHWVQSRREDRATQSMTSFQRRLSTLERTAPTYATYSDEMDLDAYSVDELGSGAGDDDDPAAGGRIDLRWGQVDAAPRGTPSAVRLGGARPALSPSAPSAVATASAAVAAPAPAVVRAGSRIALHRRRQVFFTLLAASVASLGVAVLVSSLAGWMLHAGLSLLFLAYVALLVRHHQRAVEHAVKVRYLGPAPARLHRPAVVVLRSSSAR